MTQLLRSFGDLLVVALIGIPVAVLLWWGWAKLRGDRWQAAGDVAVVLSCLPVAYLVFSPTYGAPSQVSLLPGAELASPFDGVRRGETAAVVQLVANTVLLLPLGVVLPLRFRWARSVARIGLVALMASLAVEFAQYFLAVGRVSSTDDVILNTAGALLGAWAARGWRKWRSTSESPRSRYSDERSPT
ncbi:VanZ family protein [Actinopolyspora alba]|uniref:VanZ family protein n=1 Tax=Actinopolyspora alba TaxID=673379 RepID=UPI0015871657|nr:VanZ family protein [Actinopolyspora alba]